MNGARDIELILATARELYGRAVYSHKVHEVERELCSKSVTTMNIINIVLAALTTVLAVISVSLKPLWAMIATAAAAAFSVCFAIWQASFDPASKEQRQRTAAKELLSIREQFLLLIQKCHISNADPTDLQKCLEGLTTQLLAAYKFVPNTESKAYGIADGRLKGAQFTFADKEIDGFLPTELRKAP